MCKKAEAGDAFSPFNARHCAQFANGALPKFDFIARIPLSPPRAADSCRSGKVALVLAPPSPSE